MYFVLYLTQSGVKELCSLSGILFKRIFFSQDFQIIHQLFTTLTKYHMPGDTFLVLVWGGGLGGGLLAKLNGVRLHDPTPGYKTARRRPMR